MIEYDANPCFRRFGATRRRRLPAQNHHRRHDETARKLREDHHQRGSTTRRDLLHGNWSVDHDQRSSISSTRRRRRQRQRIEMNKRSVSYALPIHMGFFVLQYAKLRMLQFYYDFVDRYIERPLFEYCGTDTDSAYFALLVSPSTTS